MSVNLTSEQVWEELEKQLFAVLGMVNAKNEARTIGMVYTARDHKIYMVTGKETWKARYVQQNPHVSITVPITKRIPLLPWVKIPAATITFAGLALAKMIDEVDDGVLSALLRGLENDPAMREKSCIIVVEPVGDFITYGIGVSLMTMRTPARSRGRVSVHPVDFQ
ncbi:MAG: pyridoxamine 5'-phosphate oxidase family protein [Ardenticatenaceae bacterium]|nr:pyridoxamine 5'-phosphate oxidase family protein [Ardenticatenaceae bacterium]MCB9443751.1 pyridoxamine 5'-phosphate oxidase family protein [Ardenticatenaceae bacterium]